jgi:flagellar assembly factor FliW
MRVEAETVSNATKSDYVVHMEEGLIGFSNHKQFVFSENAELVPFRLMESVGSPKVEFLVIDPNVLVPGYSEVIPDRTWESMGIDDRNKRLVFVVASLGATPKESIANLQAPILVNYDTMTARQVILTDPAFPIRHPLG